MPNNKTLYYHFVGKIFSGAIRGTITADTLYDFALEKMDAETIKKYLPRAIRKLVSTTWLAKTNEVQRSGRNDKTYNPVYRVNEAKRKFVLDWQPSP